ncbi:pyruvate, phosphate dikinase [Nitrospina gracilis]|uniref:pyruvate, phosphate dikinase n=1 Tax=Nitrospina gracilis TaxID=35801 RepID=UPI001F002D1D|nr:pyruvate, phosphate dikinase [Nitrospina gracilis]MCF8721880.1 pyruvate,orthophosphate dikinase [Nitrospina gracilis Nb-211]
MSPNPKYVYFFGANQTEGKAEMRELLGGKGANLAEMASLGINVPPGFTITTEACNYYFKKDQTLPPSLWDEIIKNLKNLEKVMDKAFGGKTDPLLLSVRSGARVSMPGMMDTVLNLGLNEDTMKALAKKTSNNWFAHDCYRRFIAMFGNVVLGIDGEHFETILERKKEKRKVKFDTDLLVDDLKGVIKDFKALVKKKVGRAFPEDPVEQLRMSIEAVFNSWNIPRAIHYRRLNHIPEDWGTAVNVQSMVFGNMGPTSATGVAFTRNPATGEKKFYGEYMINAQGEDVVAGIRTPQPIAKLKEDMPASYDELLEVYQTLENHYKDMQDIEFTIEDNRLYMLQTRSGKRTAAAAIRIAVDMVNEGLISKQEALLRVPAEQVDQIFHPMIDPKSKVKVLGKGLGASPGAATGKVVFSPDVAAEMARKKERVILVRTETSPEDIHGMSVAQGILTAKGGMTSHAAVVARAMGKPCVSGLGELSVDMRKKKAWLNGAEIKELDPITLDGADGRVMLGAVKLVQPRVTGYFTQLMSWVDKARNLGVRANADTPHDALVAREFGAQGIGLCRTEHMFFDEDRILLVRKMIVADKEKTREEALKKLLPIQRSDFTQIFKAMEGLPVTIRLLDPPLHEFLPADPKEIKTLAKQMKVSPSELTKKINSLKEANPMLGLRGCRLGLMFPEIYKMQVSAIIEAACKLVKKGTKVFPEIMIPLVGHVEELRQTRAQLDEVAQDIIKKSKVKLDYKVGTMIELPRAAITADEIAQEADFFSFGTNDLTQTTFGLSRDDSGMFLPEYIEKGVLDRDPFVSVDVSGVGELVRLAAEKGRAANKKIHLGICGEHGGDPKSIEFFNSLKLDYVSCSPFRVPTALLSAAQAAIKDPKP